MSVIGISRCRSLEDYRQSILHVGGDVRILDSTAPAEGALDGIDGLMLTGGGDVDPALYHETPDATIVPAESGRDDFEIALILEARRRQIPILAICRGIQVLNVAAGGSLYQDIPSQLPGAGAHSLEVPAHEPYELAHEIWIEKDSLLSRLMRERIVDDGCEVNSRHHQAVKQIAPGLKVTATAPDGVIEAIEDPAAIFCLGVQWHPENFFRTGEFRAIFEGFLDAATKP
jgi:putative glutamine amidotransferase